LQLNVINIFFVFSGWSDVSGQTIKLKETTIFFQKSKALMFKLNLTGKWLLRKKLKVARHRRIEKW
jgi:hypothetical protein